MRFSPCLLVLVAVSLICTASASASTDFYVAPDGSDSAPGTIDAPFATLQRAQAAVRAATPAMTSDIVVNLRGGTYNMRSALRLANADGDSGLNGHRVVYQAYGYGTPDQETPILSGGRAVEKWRLADAHRHIWRADVGGFSTRQLYRDGERLERGSIGAIPGKVRRTSAGYTTTSTAPQKWADPDDIEFVYTTLGYSQAICGVASIGGTRTKTTITMDQPCFRWVSANYTYNGADPESPLRLDKASPVENSRSFLTTAHTWAIDTSGGHHFIYYRSGAGEDPNNEQFVVPKQQTLVKGVGTKAAPLHDVAFKGIGFDYATWLAPSRDTGFVQIFGNFYFHGGSPSGSLSEPTTRVRFVPGNLTFKHARGLLFEGNRFTHMGADSLDITGSIDNVVRGNVFANSAGGALKLDGLNDGSDSGNLVEDNWVHDIGGDYQASIAVYLEDIVDSTLQHNQINHVPYSGIAQTISEATGHGVQILDNRIFDVVGVMMDGGAIYTSGAQGPSYAEGGVIAGNDVHGAINPRFEAIDPGGKTGAPNAIYTDVGADFITLQNNLIYDNHQSWGGVSPGAMRFTNNFWDDDRLVFYGSTKGLVKQDNTLLTSDDPRAECAGVPACAAILDTAGLEPAWLMP